MKGFFSFFTVLYIALIGIYLVSVNSAENALRLGQDKTQVFMDSLFYSKADASNSFWAAAKTREGLEKWGGHFSARGFIAGFGEFPDAGGTGGPLISYSLDSTVGGRYRMEDFLASKCPVESTEECILVTGCISEDCAIFKGPVGFYARLERDGAGVQFAAMQGDYVVLD